MYSTLWRISKKGPLTRADQQYYWRHGKKWFPLLDHPHMSVACSIQQQESQEQEPGTGSNA